MSLNPNATLTVEVSSSEANDFLNTTRNLIRLASEGLASFTTEEINLWLKYTVFLFQDNPNSESLDLIRQLKMLKN